MDAVIFDGGGALTPWHSVDPAELWSAVRAPHFPADEAAAIACPKQAGGGWVLVPDPATVPVVEWIGELAFWTSPAAGSRVSLT